MRTIFAKYNRERLPCFQTVTKIVKDGNGKKFAAKEPLSESGSSHIETIYSNYRRLTEKYGCALAKPTLSDNGVIIFEYLEGPSLDAILLRSAMNGDFDVFDTLLQKFVVYLDGFVSERNVIFNPCSQFLEVFGEWNIEEMQDIIEIANVDLIFGNLFLQDDRFVQIDYEWVFGFRVPKNFILWRSVSIFLSYYENLYPELEMRRLFAKIISLEKYNHCFKNDANFYKYVCGNRSGYTLNYSIAKLQINPLQTIEQQTQTIEQQTQTIEQQTQTIEQQTQTIEQQTQTIELQSQTIEQQTQTIELQSQTIELQSQSISELIAKNVSLENEVIKYAMSRSWCITRPLRALMRMLSASKKLKNNI